MIKLRSYQADVRLAFKIQKHTLQWEWACMPKNKHLILSTDTSKQIADLFTDLKHVYKKLERTIMQYLQ